MTSASVQTAEVTTSSGITSTATISTVIISVGRESAEMKSTEVQPEIARMATSVLTTSLMKSSSITTSPVLSSTVTTHLMTSSAVTTSSVKTSVTSSSVILPSKVRGLCTLKRPPKTAVTWLSLVCICLKVTAVSSETCVFKEVKKNSLTGREELILETRDCQWACCVSTCCPPPVSLVVGAVLGSAVLVAVLVTLICCCCLNRKGERHRGQRGSLTAPSIPRQQTSVIFHSETSGQAGEYIHHSVRYDDAPPSYEEVMRAELNQTFKPETG